MSLHGLQSDLIEEAVIGEDLEKLFFRDQD